MRIDLLPREQDPELARLIALAFHDYPPFRHIHQPLAGEAYRAVLEQNFAYYKHEPVSGVPYFYIDTLAVHPDSQGKGHARALVDYVADLSYRHPTSAAVCLSTEDDRNHAFYEGLGFEKESQLTLGIITSTAFKLVNRSPETR